MASHLRQLLGFAMLMVVDTLLKQLLLRHVGALQGLHLLLLRNESQPIVVQLSAVFLCKPLTLLQRILQLSFGLLQFSDFTSVCFSEKFQFSLFAGYRLLGEFDVTPEQLVFLLLSGQLLAHSFDLHTRTSPLLSASSLKV